MSAVVIRPDTHVLKCQAKYGFVLAEQLDNSASGAGGVKADAVGREPAVSHDAKQATSSRQDDSMTTRDSLRTRGAQQGVLGPGATPRGFICDHQLQQATRWTRRSWCRRSLG